MLSMIHFKAQKQENLQFTQTNYAQFQKMDVTSTSMSRRVTPQLKL